MSCSRLLIAVCIAGFCGACVPFTHAQNLAADETQSEKLQDHLSIIRQMINSGEASKALDYAEEQIAKSPGDLSLVAGKGMALRSLKRFDAAVEFLSQSIAAHPRETELVFQRALAFRSLGNDERFQEDFTKIIELGDYIGYILAASFHHSRKDLAKEIHAYTKLLEIWPNDKNAHSWQESRAIAFSGLRVLDWAGYDISSAMEKVPTTSKLLLQGELGILSGNFDSADSVFKLAVENTDVKHVPVIRKINALVSAHEFYRAEELVAEFKIQNQDMALRDDIVAIEKRLRARNELRDLQRKAAKQNRRPSGLLSAKRINLQRKRIIDLLGDEGVAPEGENSLKGDGNELKQLLLQHVHLGMFTNDVEYAVQLLLHLEKIRSQLELTAEESATELTVRAWLRMQADQNKKAAELISKAIELDPNFASAHRVAASIYFQTDELQQALEHAEKSVEIDPYNSINLGYRGLINMALGNYQDSARDYFRSLELDPGNKWSLSLVEKLANLQGLPNLALRYQSERLGIDYRPELLERAEYWIQLDLPQLALADIEEFATLEDKQRESEGLLLKARAIYLWMKDCETGGGTGPSEEAVIEAAVAAQNVFPDFYLPYLFSAEAQLRNSEFADSAQSITAAMERVDQPIAYLFELGCQAFQMTGDSARTKQLIKQMDTIVQQDETLSGSFDWALSTAKRSVELREHLEQLDLHIDTGNKLVEMQPTRAELTRVFDEDFAAQVALLCKSDEAEMRDISIPETHKKIRIATATTEDFLATDEVIRKYHFPYGMRVIAHRMLPGVVWHLVKLTPDDDTSGLSFAAIVKIDGRWVAIGRPWRAADE